MSIWSISMSWGKSICFVLLWDQLNFYVIWIWVPANLSPIAQVAWWLILTVNLICRRFIKHHFGCVCLGHGSTVLELYLCSAPSSASSFSLAFCFLGETASSGQSPFPFPSAMMVCLGVSQPWTVPPELWAKGNSSSVSCLCQLFRPSRGKLTNTLYTAERSSDRHGISDEKWFSLPTWRLVVSPPGTQRGAGLFSYLPGTCISFLWYFPCLVPLALYFKIVSFPVLFLNF